MTAAVHLTRPADGVVLIRLDNPPSNALGSSMRSKLLAELDVLEADTSVRAIILTGTGKGFCSGDDLSEAKDTGGASRANLDQFGRVLARIEAFRAPIIAAINGHSVGGGLELALVCDIRVASTAAKFIAAGVNVGLMASVHRLPRLIGVARAKAMLLTGLPTDAATALTYGLITGLFEPEALIPEALKLAERIASRAPLSVEAVKRQTATTWPNQEEAGRAAAAELAVLSKTEDHLNALAAFAAKQQPVFKRR